MTTNSDITLDAASATNTGTLPLIGGAVSVTSATVATSADASKVGTVASGKFAIAFTTATKLLNGGKITFTFPSSYFSAIVTSGAALSGQSTTAPSAVSFNAPYVVMTVGADLPSGSSTLTLDVGWTPGASLSTASYPTIANFNKGSYTLSNLVTPAKYFAASSGGLDYQIKFGSSECSADLKYPQIGTPPPSPPGTPGGPAASAQGLFLSVVLAVGSALLSLL